MEKTSGSGILVHALTFLLRSVEINVVIIAACVPPIRPLYLILFHLPGAEYYGGSSRQKESHQRHASPRDQPRKKTGPDTELMSLDTGWNATMLRGTDGDGDGLVEIGDGMIRQTVEMDVSFDSKRDSANVEEGRQRRSGENWW